jgi:uracil-DNA glycosylase
MASAVASAGALDVLNDEIVNCFVCPRLVAYREEIGRVQRRAYRGQQYWSRPVPGFGDPRARLLMIGLAPGAHGANRTGRMFTGDRSGEFLYRALWEAGFANQRILDRVRVIVALGGIALDAYLSVLQDSGCIRSRAAFPFAHGACFATHSGGPLVLCCYHPSQQNTSTRRLTADMLREIFLRARQLLEAA